MIRLSAFADESDATIEGQILALKRNGISYIELRWIKDKNIADITEEEARTYAKKFEDEKIKVWAIGSPIGKVKLSDDFEIHKKRLRNTCKVAKIFGTNKIRMFSFFETEGKDKEVYCRLNEMVNIATEEGVFLYHENEKFIFGDKVDKILDIMKNVQGLKYIYDPANYIEVGEDMDKALDALHDTTDYFHIKDVIRSTGELVPAGEGDGKIIELIKRIKDKDIVLSIEPHLAIFDAFAHIDSTQMKNKYRFKSKEEAFDAAVSAVKKVLKEAGYKERCNGLFDI